MSGVDRMVYESRQKRLGTCRVCLEPVLWATTPNGRRVPLHPIAVLDLEPVVGGLYTTSGGRAWPLKGSELYRVHNNGRCIAEPVEDAAVRLP